MFIQGEYRITQRAAWPISYCVRNHPKLVQPYYEVFLNLLEQKGLHNAIIRNTVRLLQDVDIPKKYHGKLMSLCFEFIQSNETASAIKAFSLTILQNLSVLYPEILPELRLIIEERWPFETAAFHVRARKILKSAVV